MGVEEGSRPRALIADDEAPARAGLRALLEEDGRVEVVGEAATGTEALSACRTLKPDVVFLDIRMPDGSGMDVARTLQEEEQGPRVVFVTAYDKYAVKAFELEATDYLVKPFDGTRLTAALDRVLRLEASAQPSEAVDTEEPTPKSYLERIGIESRGTVTIISVTDVDYVTSDGNYLELVSGSKKHLLRESLSNLQDRLDPTQFCRIHRSTLVNINKVQEVKRRRSGDCVVVLNTGAQLKGSRTHREHLERHLGIGLS